MSFSTFSRYAGQQQQQQQPNRLGSEQDFINSIYKQSGMREGQLTPAMRAQIEQARKLYQSGDVAKAEAARTAFASTANPMMQQVRANQPWARAGKNALQQQQALLGLKGDEAMQQAYGNNPAHQFAQGQMEQALMRNAAATGGLRGSDVQRELAEYTSGLTNQNIQNQLGQLGLMSEQGRMARGNIGQARAGQWIDNASIQSRMAEQRAAARASRGSGFSRALGAAGGIAQVGMMLNPATAGFGAAMGFGSNLLSGIGQPKMQSGGYAGDYGTQQRSDWEAGLFS
jgi:hypothetical protein